MAQTITPRAGPLPIAEGGTNATTALGALVELGVPMGEVEQISVGPGLTGGGGGSIVAVNVGNISIPQGGTGQTNANNARNALGAAPLANPNFTGAPRAIGTAPLPNDSSDRLATTAWVTSKLGVAGGGVDGGTY